MSESDDVFSNNVFTYQNENTMISARGPGIRQNNMTGISLRSNILTSTLLPGNIDSRCGSRNYEQRSVLSRREISPASIRSDFGHQNPYNIQYSRCLSSQRSVFNGRSGSPNSLRSINSTSSVSAIDIANAFKYMNFNKHELRIIKVAYNKCMRNKGRKRIEKRRNLKLFLKGFRRKSGYDSGELGSDSSLSSDECKSVRSTVSHINADIRTKQQHKLNASLVRSSIKDSDIYNDCTENIKLNSLRNIFSVKPRTDNVTMQSNNGMSVISEQNNCVNNTLKSPLNHSTSMTLKDRFTKGFQLPSQRFQNKSKIRQCETNNNCHPLQINKSCHNNEKESDEEQIFSEICDRDNKVINSDNQKKRILDENYNLPERKKNKIDSPKHCISYDNIFKKPKMPVKKVQNPKKNNVTEKLISRSTQPLTDTVIVQPSCTSTNLQPLASSNEVEIENQKDNEIENVSDVSTKPSFMKRKLFTQKLDHLDKQNCNDVSSPSPQNKPLKGKSKIRKLVTSQSCLSRDLDNDSNVMDLIHKIVTPEEINSTVNKTANNRNMKISQDNDKWDVTSVLSMCNSEDGSETYTDEEIFKINKIGNINKKATTEPKKSNEVSKTNNICKVVIERTPAVDDTRQKSLQCTTTSNSLNANKRTVSKCVKSFWDTDFESDIETQGVPSWKTRVVSEQVPIKDSGNKSMKKANTTVKGTIMTIRGSQNKVSNNKTQLTEATKATSDVTKHIPTKSINEKCKTAKVSRNNNTKQDNIVKNKENIINPTIKRSPMRSCKKPLDTSGCEKDTKSTSTTTKLNNKKNDNNTKAVTKSQKKTIDVSKNKKENNKKKKTVIKTQQKSVDDLNISCRSLRSYKKLNTTAEA